MNHYGSTYINPLALLGTLAAAVFLLTTRRSRALLPFVLVACLVPVAQRVVIATLDFNMIRVMVLFAWTRLLLRGELRRLRLHELDVAFVVWTLAGSATYVAREATLAAAVYRLGWSFDSLGTYFGCRMLLRQPSDSLHAVRYLAWCAVFAAAGMLSEWFTGHNPFALLGGVPDVPWIRDGHLRCRGAFAHPILAGSFGATIVPIFVAMWFAIPRWRRIAAVGAASGAAIAVTSASSGAIVSAIAGLVAFALWPLRRHARAIRWGLLLGLTVVHVAREKPVWHLIGRAAELFGGEGYQRYRLIDAFVEHWGEWWMLGTSSTEHWGWMLWDTTNQYVDEGVTGGVLKLAAFVALIVLAYRAVGIAGTARGRPAQRRPRDQRMWCWGLRSALTAHCVAFISVSYWGQMQIIFFLLLALIGAERSFVTRTSRPAARRPTGEAMDDARHAEDADALERHRSESLDGNLAGDAEGEAPRAFLIGGHQP